MSPSFDRPRAILISSDTAQTGQGNRWTCIERTSIEQPHSSRNFGRRLSLSMQFSRDWPGDGRNRRLFIVPVSREAEQRIIGGLRIVVIKVQSIENGIDVIISLKLPRYKLFDDTIEIG